MGLFGNIFNGGGNPKIEQMLSNGAQVIDVRTPAEFQGGHVPGSKNIPLNVISNRVNEIKALKKPVVLCCASGGRSGQATAILKQEDIECENGGGWTQVNSLVTS